MECKIQSGLGRSSPEDNEIAQIIWKFLPNEMQEQEQDDVAFEDPYNKQSPKHTATFQEKGQYQLQLVVKEGELEANGEIIIGIDEPPKIESDSVLTGMPECRFENDTHFWIVELNCTINSGLGYPEEHADKLIKTWEVVSGPQSAEFEIVETIPHENDPCMLDVKALATFQQGGAYQLWFKIVNEPFNLEAISEKIDLDLRECVTDGLQALYTFEAKSGTTVFDVSGLEIPLNLDILHSDATSWNGGLKIQAPALLSAEGKRIAAAIKKSGEITLEAWIKPEEENESGLRRILTLSNGPAARDFILAQSGDTYHAGLRTTYEQITDVNASLKSIVGGAVNTKDLSHVVFTRNKSGEARLYINKEIVASRMVSGDFSEWDDDFKLALGNEFVSDDKPDRAWSGEYHLVAIYDRALTSEEIQQNFDFGADRDLPPKVFAGEDRDINWSVEGVTKTNNEGSLIVQMQGRVIHDRPTDGTTQWKQVTANDKLPEVTFANPSDPATEAYFPRSGNYKLRLTADDGILAVSREVTIDITHETPDVAIEIPDEKMIVTPDGVNAITLVGGEAELKLNGTIKNSLGDDYPLGKLDIEWTCYTNNVEFDDANKLDPTVSFKKNGVYELTLTVVNQDDSKKTASPPVQITVDNPPVIDAGFDQVITLPKKAILDATISDDGFPTIPGVLDLTWTDITENAPGEAIFTDPKADYTPVSFTDKGTYTLKLVASDGVAASEDEVTVIVNKAPVVDAGEGDRVKYNEPIPLNGAIIDDGFGNESQQKPISKLWEMESGPEQPTFADATGLNTTVKFPKKGIYVLKLTATSEYGEGSDTITFTVNEPPRISFKGKTSYSKNSTLALVGVIDDDGLGDPARDKNKIGIHWKQTSGPSATIRDEGILNPTVTIIQGNSGVGQYEFTLTVTNPSFSTSVKFLITVTK